MPGGQKKHAKGRLDKFYHMAKEHGFFIPYMDYVTDLRGRVAPARSALRNTRRAAPAGSHCCRRAGQRPASRAMRMDASMAGFLVLSASHPTAAIVLQRG